MRLDSKVVAAFTNIYSKPNCKNFAFAQRETGGNLKNRSGKGWLGREDSNLRSSVPKTAALPTKLRPSRLTAYRGGGGR